MSEAERIEVPEETLESDTPPEAEAAAATLEITQPDAVIAVPTDDRLMADAFMELSKSTKIVFLGSIIIGIPIPIGSFMATAVGLYFLDIQ